jgi:hypothetical protein
MRFKRCPRSAAIDRCRSGAPGEIEEQDVGGFRGRQGDAVYVEGMSTVSSARCSPAVIALMSLSNLYLRRSSGSRNLAAR